MSVQGIDVYSTVILRASCQDRQTHTHSPDGVRAKGPDGPRQSLACLRSARRPAHRLEGKQGLGPVLEGSWRWPQRRRDPDQPLPCSYVITL